MLIEIKNRFTGTVIFSHEAENNTMKLTVEAAVKSQVYLRNSNLSGSYLRNSNLSGSNLSNSDLRNSDLSNSNLRNSDLSDSNLRGSNLRGSDLSNSDLSNSDLRGSNLRGSNLSNSYLSNSYLSGGCYGAGIPLTAPPLHILGLKWPVLILDMHIKIGCELHLTSEWIDFKDSRIALMEATALDFWTANKELILCAAKTHRIK